MPDETPPEVVDLQHEESVDWLKATREEDREVEVKPIGDEPADWGAVTASLGRQYSEGDEVETPDGVGVVAEIRTESFDGPNGDEVEASDDSPAYVVATRDGAAVFRASDITAGEIAVDGDTDPAGDLAEAAAALDVAAADAAPDAEPPSAGALAGDNGRTFDYPDSWQESETPNRVILLKAWSGVGGSFSSCRSELSGEVAAPARLCASMKDRVLNWEGWRNGG